ncbi:cysteine proteinase [Dothidotthia symphoricarpi CBS 119687]|uniref:ubiquitinyl hydrolase 1 n=1 Tax=Dothidotthia symphoricarpi CBS 119687 TaxID=1392245 RepID=A0A6A6A5J4_9PLEO|nr:cysteine proteinase [Dothidotthia symphoricarpi CBS 119687]KAF2126435.1 cysteine proteinase [Dothidotthia symphoricarpi CBS 119687]
MGYSNYPMFEDPVQRWNAPDSNTLYTSVLLATVAGAYVFFKALELLGYPVWLWAHQLVHMSAGVLRLRGTSLSQSSATDPNDDTMQRGGGILSSIFGLNSGSLLQKGVRSITGALSTGPSDVPPGLGNWDNSCYQNSIVQGLASLPSLRDYLSKTTAEHASLTEETTNGALYDMISKLNAPESHGQHFMIRGKLKSMSTFQQQDAQEYYSKILDALDEEVKKVASSKRRTSVSWLEATKSLSLPEAESDDETGTTKEADNARTPIEPPKIMPNPLDGLLAQRVGCTTCGHSDGLSLIPFNCLTVSLGRSYGYDISECLDEYTSLEYIDGVECAKCTLLKLKGTLTPIANAKPGSPFEAKLNAVQEALDEDDFEDKTLVKTFNVPKKNWIQCTKSKQAVIARAPKSLVLHVNRSIFDETNGMQYKNHAAISYPGILDLGNWCLGSQPSGSQHPDMCLEEWPRDPTKSMLAEGDPMTTSPFQYRLRASVTHSGSHGNGHYVCYRPHPQAAGRSDADDEGAEQEKEGSSGEQWWRFSDDSVYAVPESQAHRGDVFMLFYEHIDEPIPSAKQETDPIVTSSAISEEAPLPPLVLLQGDEDTGAAEVPLPEDDDLADLVPPASISPSVTQEQPLGFSGYMIPPASLDNTDTETVSEMGSEDAPSTHCTSDSEADPPTPKDTLPQKFEGVAPPVPQDMAPLTPKNTPSFSPHMMRTGTARGQGSGMRMPLVSAT